MANPEPPDHTDTLGPLLLESSRNGRMNFAGIGCGVFFLGWAVMGVAIMMGWMMADERPGFRVFLGVCAVLTGLGVAALVLRQVLSNLDLVVRVHERGLLHRVRGTLTVLRHEELTDLRRTNNDEFTLRAGERTLRIEALGPDGDSFGVLLNNAQIALRGAALEEGKSLDFGALSLDAAGVHANGQLFAWDEAAVEQRFPLVDWALRTRDGARSVTVPAGKILWPDVLTLLLMQRGVVEAPHPQSGPEAQS